MAAVPSCGLSQHQAPKLNHKQAINNVLEDVGNVVETGIKEFALGGADNKNTEVFSTGETMGDQINLGLSGSQIRIPRL